jgi:type VI secretion system secreted protein VgrG
MPLPNFMPNSVEAKIQALEARVAALEKALQVSAHQVVLQTGNAKITLNPGGDVQIMGHSIKLASMGEIQIKAAGNLILKGANIKQN